MVKKKPKKGIKFMQMGHLPFELCISYNLTCPELLSRLKRKGACWAEAAEMHRECLELDSHYAIRQTVKGEEGSNQCFIIKFYGELELDVEDLGTISHETYHITQFVFKVIQADLQDERENAAYFHEYLFKETVKFVQKVNAG